VLRSRGLQLYLPMGLTACTECPYALLKLCDGPTTRESIFMQDASVIGCLDGERLGEFYRDLHKRYYPQPHSSNQANLCLPNFIPMVAESKMNLADVSPARLLGISLGDILNDSGRVAFKSAAHVRKRLNLSSNARLALIGTGEDWKLERFWKLSDLEDSWRRIVELEFEFVTSCTFSIWYEHPRFDQIYNRERNMYTHDLFSRMGVPTIPFILFSKNELDYQENIEWLKAREDLTVVAMLGQTRKTLSDFLVLIEEIKAIRKEIDRPLHFLVVGVAEANRIASILHISNATIITSRPFQAALHGEQTNGALEYERDYKQSREYLFKYNVEQFEKYCTGLCPNMYQDTSLSGFSNIDSPYLF
jgi:hypothetical protein